MSDPSPKPASHAGASSNLMPWVRVAGRMGRAHAWLFEGAVALTVGVMVSLLLVALDRVSPLAALVGGVIAALPSLALAALSLELARALAQSSAQREALHLGEEDLLGVSNRHEFLRLAEREWMRCRRYGDNGALLQIEIDHLDRIGQQLGSRCAEAVELEVTRRVGSTLRQSDLLASFDGSQLAVFLAHTDPLGALDAAERIRQQVACAPMLWDSAQVVATVSVGVAHVHLGQIGLEGLLADADAALSAATEAGRNCVRATPQDSRPAAARPTIN